MAQHHTLKKPCSSADRRCIDFQECLVPGKHFLVRIVIFDVVMPILKGSRAELYAHSLCEPCTVTRLKATINKASGEVLKLKPRYAVIHWSNFDLVSINRLRYFYSLRSFFN